MQPIGGPSRPVNNPGNPPLHTVPPGGQMDPRYRPGSPTHRYLLAQARTGQELGEHMGPTEAMGVREMTREEAAATHLFKQNLDAVDPARTLRNQGEFGQAYRPGDQGMLANTPLHFEPGGQVTVPPRAHSPETTHIIHSHPPSHPGFPTDADYYSAYIQSQGNRNGVKGEIMYDAAKDKFFAYQGKLHAETGGAAYHELVNPFDMGPKALGPQASKALPDPDSYGQHFINWPESRPATPENGAPGDP